MERNKNNGKEEQENRSIGTFIASDEDGSKRLTLVDDLLAADANQVQKKAKKIKDKSKDKKNKKADKKSTSKKKEKKK